MEKVVLYVGLTDEENKALSSEEIESTLTKRATALMDYAEALNYEVVGIYRDGYYIGNSENRINFNNMLSSLVNKSVNIVLSTYDEIISNVKEKFNEFISKLNEKKIEFKSISKLNPEDTIASRRNQQLKDLMDDCKLEYVSPSIINLLNLDIKNDDSFLSPSYEIKKRAAYVREIYNSEYNWYVKMLFYMSDYQKKIKIKKHRKN